MKWFVLALALISCGEGDCPSNEGAQTDFLESGVYESEGPCDGGAFCDLDYEPRRGGSNYEMNVDEASQRVIVRFERDGVEVEETWRIIDRRLYP